MRISNIKLNNFRRFTDFEIRDIPETAKLIVLAGPNGSGKSSLFDAFLLRYREDSQYGWNPDLKYYNKSDKDKEINYLLDRVEINTHSNQKLTKGTVYIRTAYRNDHEFSTNELRKQGEVLDNQRLSRLIEPDATVAINYQRLASNATEDILVNEDSSTTIGDYRKKLIGEVSEPLQRIFHDLVFVGVGNPFIDGSFQFDKGNSRNFDYKNLSGGEKAAFDLILDFVIKRRSYPEAIYCIDEPEMHMNTKLQGKLLEELVGLLPKNSQLWIASHSIGMMRKAREMYDENPSSVAFIDFGGQDFDQAVVLKPAKPTQAFWHGVMEVALDDLATLIAPSQIVICEGNPKGSIAGKNTGHDAEIYNKIFSEEIPDALFISAGNSKEIQNDFIGLATVLPQIATGIKTRRLIDRDEHHIEDVEDFKSQDIMVLSRRHLECYLYDDEVLTKLCYEENKPEAINNLIEFKRQAINRVVERGHPEDDIKKAAGEIYESIIKLKIIQKSGNDNKAFERRVLSKLITPGMNTYRILKEDIFN
ncbi:AAA family ATPase [Vreelandella neptunia]|uniref:AAA family ATPase n=1 Tax=Vreelandella neptunia TaxID=115551 RepID=A0ABS9S0Z3_9GAMM|nr:AAA family ATPase [Halomonas neptunia]